MKYFRNNVKTGQQILFVLDSRSHFYYMLAKPDGEKSSFQTYYLHSQQV